jgi:hypothetical protein
MKKIIISLLLISFSFDASAFNAGARVDDTNSLPTSIVPGANPSYIAQAAAITPAATATDVVTICGSATKTVKVIRSEITSYATGASVIDFYLIKRTTANTGGTSSAITSSRMNSSNSVATAVVTRYTANPSALGSGNTILVDHYEMSAVTGNSYFTFPWVEHFGNIGNQAITLNGVAECLAFNLNGQTLPSGMLAYVNFQWIEY